MKKFILLILVLVIAVGGYVWYKVRTYPKVIDPAPVGKVTYKDLIQIDTPTKNATISNPLIVSGWARGNWYFEASFPVEVRDADGTVLGSGPVQAKGEWMTTNYVPFEGSITFTTPHSKTGFVIFHKDNPSGLPENDDSISIPVNF